MRWITCLIVLTAVAGCRGDHPEKQCDPERRCTAADAPVCGDDGVWYECGLVADCHEVAVTLNESSCGDLPDFPPDDRPPVSNPPTVCADIACSDGCAGVYDAQGCLDHCECNNVSVICEEVSPNCRSTDYNPVTGCTECLDCLHIACQPGCEVICRDDGTADCDCPTCPDVGPCPVDEGCERTVDENGCDTCVCEGACERQFCAEICPHGHVIDDAGCPTCECYEPCNELPLCDLFCEEGYAIDTATGCSLSCECLDDCGPVDCLGACEWGFRRDSRGCEVCECRGAPCISHTDCALDEACVPDPFDLTGAIASGECVKLDTCDGVPCSDARQCGFYYREDCCPPSTTCVANLPYCPSVCLLGPGDLP